MHHDTFIPKPPKTGNKYIDAILGLANNFVPGQSELGLYNSAKDAYSDYQKGDYKSLGKKAAENEWKKRGTCFFNKFEKSNPR